MWGSTSGANQILASTFEGKEGTRRKNAARVKEKERHTKGEMEGGEKEMATQSNKGDRWENLQVRKGGERRMDKEKTKKERGINERQKKKWGRTHEEKGKGKKNIGGRKKAKDNRGKKKMKARNE